jgi:membrane associated rhomboid family serine protease
MPGRYQFQLPERRQRDGWFRIGGLDVTTTALMVLLGVGSMFVYALSSTLLAKFQLDVIAVRDGQLWRVVTWPLVNPPTQIWVVLTLVFFWFFGHRVEDEIGRKRFTWLILAMTVLPALAVSAIDFGGDNPYAYGLGILGTALLVIFALDNPGAMFFFNIPAWIIALVFVGIEVLSLTGERAWNQLFLELLCIAVGLVGARQCGMVEVLHWIPRVTGGGDRRRTVKAKKSKQLPSSASSVITGPWGTGAHAATDQIELDTLLDKISASGMDSLSRAEKQRLNELSKRLRGS